MRSLWLFLVYFIMPRKMAAMKLSVKAKQTRANGNPMVPKNSYAGETESPAAREVVPFHTLPVNAAHSRQAGSPVPAAGCHPPGSFQHPT